MEISKPLPFTNDFYFKIVIEEYLYLESLWNPFSGYVSEYTYNIYDSYYSKVK